MAAAAAALRSPWSTLQTSCVCGAVILPVAEVRWGSTATFSLKKVGCCPSKRLRSSSGRSFICNARYGNSAEQDASTLSEMATLVDDLAKLNSIVNEANKGVGADVRNRVDVLYNRATLLKYSADRLVDGGGRVPVQLTATLKGLQREHASVENIVRLATEAGPVIPEVDEAPSKRKPISNAEAVVAVDNLPPPLKVVVKEKEEPKISLFETLTRQSSIEPDIQPTTSTTEKYVMSTPAARNTSPLAAFRKEIERRVMEQLTGKKVSTPESDVTAKEEEEQSESESESESEVEDTAPEVNTVAGLVQNLPLRGRLPRRRVRGAVKNEALLTNAPEPQILEVPEDPISLPDSTQLVSTDSETEELDKLRLDLSEMGQQLAKAREGSARAMRAEEELQQVSEKLAGTVPLDVHNQVVKLERESLIMARTKIAQVTNELKEKEAMLSAVKQDMMAEQETLLSRVRELSGELSTRVSAEEVEAAVNNAVRELEKELRNALKRAESMQLELQTNEKQLKQLQKEWDSERTSLRGELANVKEALVDVQMEQAGDRAKLKEAMIKMQEMEESLARLQQALVDAEEERIAREKNVLATVKSLIANMVRAKKQAQLESSISPESTTSLDKSEAKEFEGNQMNNVEEALGTMFPGEKAMALESFFVMMGVLIQQESEKLESPNPLSRELLSSPRFQPSKVDQSVVRSSRGDVIKQTKPVITLYYESSWEYAYLHYSADGSEWTTLPGVCMLNGIFVNSMPLKVIDVEGSSIEFVLTDGRGSWDCAPSGGNYHIKNSGTFLLSSGIIEQKR